MHVDARIEHRILNVRTAVLGISNADDLLVLPLDHWRLRKSALLWNIWTSILPLAAVQNERSLGRRL